MSFNTDADSAKTKNVTGLLILRHVFDSNAGQPILYADLEKKVREYILSEKLNSFTQLTGWMLNDFLIKNKDQFDIYYRKERKYVKLRSRHTKCKGEHQTRTDTVVINDTPFHHYQMKECVDMEQTTDTGIGPWTTVQYKHTQKKKRLSHLNAAVNMECFTSGDSGEKQDTLIPQRNQTVCSGLKSTVSQAEIEPCVESRRRSWSTERFYTLVRNGENANLLFVQSPDIYLKNPIRFSQDTVSMWNTPHRMKAYIVIGIVRGEIVGVGEHFDVRVFDDLFQYTYFSTKPVFTCFTICPKGKVICIIEVVSSCGHGSPCIVEENVKGKDGITLKQRQIWVRTGIHNVVCKSNDITEVYQWFLGQLPKPETKLVYERNPSRKQSARNACTNTRALLTHQRTYSGTKELSSSDDVDDVDDPLCSSGDSFSFFWEAVNHFQKGHFVLLVGDMACHTRHLNALAKVPWLCVYDFDIFSCSDGLLNVVQDSLALERHLTISSWNETVDNISERGTRWCFMRGRRELSNSRTDLKSGEIEDINIWFKLVRKGLQNYCEKLANFAEDYTVPTVVFIWPDNERLLPFMVKFLFRLNDTLTSTPNIVLCMNRQPVTKSGNLKYQTLCEDFNTSISVCNLRYEQMCIGILNHSTVKSKDGISYKLPMNERYESSPISETDATWLREDFEVLFLTNPYDTSNIATEEIQQEVSNFYKGGTLPWYAWYSREAEQSVIDRDVKQDLEEKINKHLGYYRTSMITLFHAPGSGGTTLAQQTLWHFHMKVPCVHLKLRTVSHVDELDKKIYFLHDRTDLPVLLLIDGEEESKVRRLSRRLKYTVILYIKRYPYKIPVSTSNDCVYMSGYVSSTESQGLESKLGGKCGDEIKRKRLHELTMDVQNKMSKHCMYEYGMTVYLHEFKGIVSYVEGYLELDKNNPKEMSPCQKCLACLALVYYYGQTCVPCQFFSALFHKPPNFNMTLEDFPAPIQEFVVYGKSEGKRNNIRLCHYIVAKEILEQMLSRHIGKTAERTDSLGISACRNLSKFCIEFIEYASNKKTKINALSTTIRFILTKTFIFRDEKDMSDNEEQVRKRPVLSKLMIDIPGGKPLFTERLNVLKKLTESFPDDPNYCAHLGRFHAFCRPDEEHEAEKCFQRATKMCEDQIKGKRDEDIDDWMKLTMMHIYHMYGIVKQRYISKYTGRTQKEKVVAFDEEIIFHERIEELVPIAEAACELFTKSRDITPDNHDVYTYAYTGEIQSRLQICEFVNRHFRKESANNRIAEFLCSEADPRSKLFVHRSISVIEYLIIECYMDVELVDSDVTSLRKYVVWYNGLFKKQVLPLIECSSKDDVTNRRLKIAAKKLQFGKSNNILSGVETIDDEKELEEIVRLYEENFSDIQDYGFQDGNGKKELERDFRDWIFAIRHDKFKKDYSLEAVLSHVQNWNEMVRSPISTFYVFILKSLLGFGTEKTPGKTECLIEALDCKEHLIKMNHLIIRPKYPREWLGNDREGIKRLKSGIRHVGMCAEDRDVASSRIDIAVCKGTICRPNTNNVNGMIVLDLGVNTTEVRVYFIPKVVRLAGSRFAEQRVEFKMAFSIQHGFEAYNVKLLKRHGCPQCSRTLEFTSIDSLLICKCGMDVHKDEMNEIK